MEFLIQNIIIFPLSLARNSRYIRYRRAARSVPEDSQIDESQNTANKTSSDPNPPVTVGQQPFKDTTAHVNNLKTKLLELMSKFTHLFELFEDEKALSRNYLDQTDELIHM